MMDCLPQIHVAAIHAQAEHDGVRYKTFTPGIGVLCRSEDDVISGAGVYSNSHGNISKYVMAGWQPLDIGGAKAGFFLGAADGYRRGNGGFAPIGGLSVSYGNVHIIAWPKADAWSSAGASLSFTIPIK